MKKTALAAGFSLIEMAFVLVIVTLLLGGLLVPFTTQVEQRRIAETQKILEEAKEALIGYAIIHGYFPCPDKTTPLTFAAVTGPPAVPASVPNDGEEDYDSMGQCRDYVGNFPYATLGIGVADAWGNRLRYQVTSDFALHSTPFSLASLGDIQICAVGDCSSFIARNVPAVIFSAGKNGYGAINANRLSGDVTRNPCPTAGCSADENLNIHNPVPSTKFLSRVATPAGTTAGEFDDIVTWISPNVLFNRMVAAGKLP